MNRLVRNRRGFTLVELVVTIAILAVLASVAGVSIAAAVKQQNQRNDCKMLEQRFLICTAVLKDVNASMTTILPPTSEEDRIDSTALKNLIKGKLNGVKTVGLRINETGSMMEGDVIFTIKARRADTGEYGYYIESMDSRTKYGYYHVTENGNASLVSE